MNNLMTDLYATLARRDRPEDVTPRILTLLADSLSKSEKAALSHRSGGYFYSLMATDYAAPVAVAPARTLCQILGWTEPSDGEARDPAWLNGLLDRARPLIGMTAGHTDFKADRLNRSDRRAHGLELSRRRYDKLFRIIADLESETEALVIQEKISRLARLAKTGYATEISFADFASDPNSAAFITYLTANLGRRSVFTNGTQARAFDSVAEMLLKRCESSPNTNWYAISHVFPRADVLDRLTEVERAALLGRVLATLRESAQLLRWAWEKSDINLTTMIVRSGNDSSTWNALAGAWNRARDYWIALMISLGYERTFEVFLPGKVLRLMAADVAFWHGSTGGDLHADTRIWADLPKPWEVMLGEVSCGRYLITTVCARHGVDAAKSAWTAARERKLVVPVEPTPELVHGVTVNHPELAAWLRKIGAFSGYGLRLPENIY